MFSKVNPKVQKYPELSNYPNVVKHLNKQLTFKHLTEPEKTIVLYINRISTILTKFLGTGLEQTNLSTTKTNSTNSYYTFDLVGINKALKVWSLNQIVNDIIALSFLIKATCGKLPDWYISKMTKDTLSDPRTETYKLTEKFTNQLLSCYNTDLTYYIDSKRYNRTYSRQPKSIPVDKARYTYVNPNISQFDIPISCGKIVNDVYLDNSRTLGYRITNDTEEVYLNYSNNIFNLKCQTGFHFDRIHDDEFNLEFWLNILSLYSKQTTYSIQDMNMLLMLHMEIIRSISVGLTVEDKVKCYNKIFKRFGYICQLFNLNRFVTTENKVKVISYKQYQSFDELTKVTLDQITEGGRIFAGLKSFIPINIHNLKHKDNNIEYIIDYIMRHEFPLSRSVYKRFVRMIYNFTQSYNCGNSRISVINKFNNVKDNLSQRDLSKLSVLEKMKVNNIIQSSYKTKLDLINSVLEYYFQYMNVKIPTTIFMERFLKLWKWLQQYKHATDLFDVNMIQTSSIDKSSNIVSVLKLYSLQQVNLVSLLQLYGYILLIINKNIKCEFTMNMIEDIESFVQYPLQINGLNYLITSLDDDYSDILNYFVDNCDDFQYIHNYSPIYLIQKYDIRQVDLPSMFKLNNSNQTFINKYIPK